MPIDGQWHNPAIGRCDRKVAYASWSRAEARAQKQSSKTGDLIIAYQCYDCIPGRSGMLVVLLETV